MSLLPTSSARDNLRHLRMAFGGLFGEDETRHRIGVWLPEDYDPRKRVLVMLHGLCSSPLIWNRLAHRIAEDPTLHARFQVWNVLYQTNAPALVVRHRVQLYLDEAWARLDPLRGDAARHGMVLIGHSFGGVVARLLCADSGTTVWDAAFTVPPDRMRGDAQDIRWLHDVFAFTAYPGITHAIFLGAPHRGSPKATSFIGRVTRLLAGGRTPEIRTLRRIATADPAAVHAPLLPMYRRGAVNSVTSLQEMQPVRIASEALLPRAGITYHTIAGVLPGRRPETDGTVPLDSATLAGSASTLLVPAGHHLYNDAAALEEVLRILRAMD